MDNVDNGNCTIYQFNEFWPSDYFPVYPKLTRRILPLHYKRIFSPEFTPAFNRDELNVCIHIRLGDNVPTTADQFILQLKLLFKYLDESIPVNVHVFYKYSKKDRKEIKKFEDFFVTIFHRAKLTLHKSTPLGEMIDLLLMSDVLIVSKSSLSTHLSIISQRPIVFDDGCVQGQHICLHSDTRGVDRDPYVEAHAKELGLRWKAWNCSRDFIEGNT
jgi:hypothetical protein